MSELPEQHLEVVYTHILKLNRQSASTPSPWKEGQDQNQYQAGAAPLSN